MEIDLNPNLNAYTILFVSSRVDELNANFVVTMRITYAMYIMLKPKDKRNELNFFVFPNEIKLQLL